MPRSRALTPLLLAVLAAPAPCQERPTGRLARELAPYFEARRWRHSTWGALVVSLSHGDTLFSWRADRLFVPASNAKLFTTAAALHYLGPDYRFLTVLLADGSVSRGELYGDLVLYGTGDPTFALDTAGLAPFADSVVRADLVVEEPAVFVAGLLRALLEARGVEITGTTRAATDEAPERARLVLERPEQPHEPTPGAIGVRRSAPLDAIVTMINHRSHNLSAELALRSIGRVRGNSGTFASGARLVQRYLVQDVGIGADAVRVSDGSGLSLLDAATPRALVQLLAYERRSGNPAFHRSLPLVGEGIRTRMTRTAAYGRLRAKTGTLTGVSALSGYVTTADGEELAFSLIVNGTPSVARARRAQDAIGARLADYAREMPPGRAAGN